MGMKRTCLHHHHLHMLSFLNQPPKMKLLSWWKLWHNSKHTHAGGHAVENNVLSTLNESQGEPMTPRTMMKIGKRDWIHHWKLNLHPDKRPSPQAKDSYVVAENPHRREQQQQQRQQQGGGAARSRFASESDQLAVSTRACINDATQLSIRTNSLDLNIEKGKDQSHNVVFMLGQKADEDGAMLKDAFTLNVTDEKGNRPEAQSRDVAAHSLDVQHHKAGLKNRVLPLHSTQENALSITDATSTITTTTGAGTANDTTACSNIDASAPQISDAVVDGNEPVALKRIVTSIRPNAAIRRTGSLSLKVKLHPSGQAVSSPKLAESPSSSQDTKWRKLLSYSRVASPRSPSCFAQAMDLSRGLRRSGRGAGAHHEEEEEEEEKGSFSTMGSPWNSHAGGRSSRAHHNVLRRSSFSQGHWITTDSDFVVLEL